MMCCYYPTTTAIIDDDTDFLMMMTRHLGINDCLPFSSPDLAVNSIKNQNPYARVSSRIVKKTFVPAEMISECPEDYAVVMNMRGLHQEIYNEDRFRDISVIVVDYHMGDLNGIDVCESLAAHPAKKILLTGGPDKEKVAIDAFNRGIIHRFINKSDANFPAKLKQAIASLKDAYFRDLTSALVLTSPEAGTTILQNPTYINFLNDLMAQVGAVEYYALDTSGSALLLDNEGVATWFMVKQESELNGYEQIAEDQDVCAEVRMGLRERSVIPFFFSEEDYQCEAEEWGKFVFEAREFPGLGGKYYACHKGDVGKNLIQEKIVSYKSYKNDLDTK